jgi:hypothetical protein
MAISNWNAGIIRPVAVPPAGPYANGAAPGVWTLDQATFWIKQGLWPTAGNVLQRGLFAGGGSGFIPTNNIQQITINTTGNAVIFGALTVNRSVGGGGGSSTRGVFIGGEFG